MGYPPRLSHLATRKVLVAKLAPTYAKAHTIDDEEAHVRLESALEGPLLERVLFACWESLRGSHKGGDEALLERVAQALADRPLRPGRVAALNPAWSAFLILADVEAGTASDAARNLLETEKGARLAEAGLSEAGRHLAQELTRR